MICNTNANGGKVLGVKGSEESEYRKGNVEITPSNLGITVINNTADSNKIVAQAAKLGSTTVGSATSPIYLSNGKATAGSTYAGGTKVILNGASKGASTANFYAPTSVGTAGQILTSNGSGAPIWSDVSSGSDDWPIGSIKLSVSNNPNFYGDEWTLANGSTITDADDEFKQQCGIGELILDNIVYNGHLSFNYSTCMYYNNIWVFGRRVSFDEGATTKYISIPNGYDINRGIYYYNGYWYILATNSMGTVSYGNDIILYLYKTTDFNSISLVTSLVFSSYSNSHDSSSYRHNVNITVNDQLDNEVLLYVKYEAESKSNYSSFTIKESVYSCTDKFTEYTGSNPRLLHKIGNYYYHDNFDTNSYKISNSLNGTYSKVTFPSSGTLKFINNRYCLFNITSSQVSSFYSYDLTTWNTGGTLIKSGTAKLVANQRAIYLQYTDGTQFLTTDGVVWIQTSTNSDLKNYDLYEASQAIVAYNDNQDTAYKCSINSTNGVTVPNFTTALGIPVFIKVK